VHEERRRTEVDIEDAAARPMTEGDVMDEWLIDNRCSSRYQAVKNTVYLGWWHEPEFRTCLAELRNLSHGGALVHVAIPPPEGASVWLCLFGTPPGEWVEVAVVSVTSPKAGEHQVRLRFPESCPYEVFNAAVLGIEPVVEPAARSLEADGAQ
jgi:hypothetical protein